MVETSQDWYRRAWMNIDRTKYAQVQCPKCGYRMPLFYTNEAECNGVRVACKGRKCSNIFEVKIKNGKQIK